MAEKSQVWRFLALGWAAGSAHAAAGAPDDQLQVW